MGQPAGGTPLPVYPLLGPECRGRQPLLDLKPHHLDGTTSEGSASLLHSCDSAEDKTDRFRAELTVEQREISDLSSVVYFCSLLVQSLPQVSNALVHHGHLSIPLVQQLLVLGQLAALLQVMTVTSLRRNGITGVKMPLSDK